MFRLFSMALAIPTILLSTSVAWAGSNVIITKTPEPASLLLLASGVAGVAVVKRFRRR